MLILINIIGVLTIALISWWFWFYVPKNISAADDSLVITVNNGSYSPSNVSISSGVPSKLTFLREDPSPCAEVVLIPELDVNEVLPLSKPISISLPALAIGEYAFHCQMQMYRGVLHVVSGEEK